MARAKNFKTEEYLENEHYENAGLFKDLYPEEEDIFDKLAVKKKRGRKKKIVD
ncbi:MAG: hypothetical protein RJQ09_17610 [Cyclobacteriaceae bacterium]